jgi:hypothetical protein
MRVPCYDLIANMMMQNDTDEDDKKAIAELKLLGDIFRAIVFLKNYFAAAVAYLLRFSLTDKDSWTASRWGRGIILSSNFLPLLLLL